MTSPPLAALFDRLAPYVLERQLLFEKEVMGQPWEADVEAGRLVVGGQSLRIEVLATYSSQTGTLLWSWARGERFGEGWPASATVSASRLRELGAGVPELEDGMLALAPEEADDLVLVALGLLGEAGVASGVPLSYRGDHAHGSVYLLVDAPERVEPVDMPALRVVSLFPQLVGMGVPLSSPRAAFVAYCARHGMQLTEGHDTVRAVDATGSSVTARFDVDGRLEGIDADLRT
jgi:hypothetical protein